MNTIHRFLLYTLALSLYLPTQTSDHMLLTNGTSGENKGWPTWALGAVGVAAAGGLVAATYAGYKYGQRHPKKSSRPSSPPPFTTSLPDTSEQPIEMTAERTSTVTPAPTYTEAELLRNKEIEDGLARLEAGTTEISEIETMYRRITPEQLAQHPRTIDSKRFLVALTKSLHENAGRYHAIDTTKKILEWCEKDKNIMRYVQWEKPLVASLAEQMQYPPQHRIEMTEFIPKLMDTTQIAMEHYFTCKGLEKFQNTINTLLTNMLPYDSHTENQYYSQKAIMKSMLTVIVETCSAWHNSQSWGPLPKLFDFSNVPLTQPQKEHLSSAMEHARGEGQDLNDRCDEALFKWDIVHNDVPTWLLSEEKRERLRAADFNRTRLQFGAQPMRLLVNACRDPGTDNVHIRLTGERWKKLITIHLKDLTFNEADNTWTLGKSFWTNQGLE